MKAFVEYVVKALVDLPEQVEVREVQSEHSIVYELRMNQTDVGKVIGKHGRTIQALRTLVHGASAKLGKRATVEIIEERPPGAAVGDPPLPPAPPRAEG